MTEEQQKLVTDNLPFVHHILKTKLHMYFSESKRHIREYEDLYQQGCYALSLAASRFDPDKGFAFITYAATYIEGMIRRYIREKDCRIRLKRDDLNIISNVVKISNDMGLDLNDQLDEIIEILEITDPNDISNIKAVIKLSNVMCLDANTEGKEEGEIAGSYHDVTPSVNFDYDDVEFLESLEEGIRYLRDLCNKPGHSGVKFKNKFHIYEEYIYNIIYCDTRYKQRQISKKYGISQSYASRVIDYFDGLMKEYLYRYVV